MEIVPAMRCFAFPCESICSITSFSLVDPVVFGSIELLAKKEERDIEFTRYSIEEYAI